MDKNRLVPQPHESELDRRAELDGEEFEFRAFWQGRERDFIGRVIAQKYEQMIFFALDDEPERGHFVDMLQWITTDKLARPSCEPRTYFRPEDAPTILKRSVSTSWGRLYILDNELNAGSTKPAQWRLFLASSGWGEWLAALGFYHRRAIFRWYENEEIARSLTLLPPLELLSRIRTALLDAQGDAAFAREFALLSSRARHQKCRPLARDSYSQWEHILRLFLQSRISLWDTGQISCRVSIEVAPNRGSWKNQARFNTEFPKFFKWTHDYFSPTLDVEYLGRCVAAESWQKRRFQWSERLESPTQHERVEALLRLREWLADKATPEEIEALLRED